MKNAIIELDSCRLNIIRGIEYANDKIKESKQIIADCEKQLIMLNDRLNEYENAIERLKS